MSTPDNNASYLSSGFTRFSPWTRSPTMPPGKGKDGDSERKLQQQKGADHRVSHRHRVSWRNYPKDCPPLRVQWFHAVDVPKRRPNPAGEMKKEEKAPAAPKKYAAFSKDDSKALEVAFQKIADAEDELDRRHSAVSMGDIGEQIVGGNDTRSDKKPNLSLNKDAEPGAIKVPVNEDYLFDVDVEKRELGPAYWLGPIYDVRRGTWFYQDGSVQRPCDENLAIQLEEGYLKTKAWRLPNVEATDKPRAASQPRSRPTSWAPGHLEPNEHRRAMAGSLAAKGSNPDLRGRLQQGDDGVKTTGTQTPQIPNTHRLFGAHMNSVVTYQDATAAWILTDDLMSRMSSTMYQRIYGGGHFAGMKVIRGYVDASQKVESKDGKEKPATKDDEQKQSNDETSPTESEHEEHPPKSPESQRMTLQRQMSSLLEDPSHQDPAKQEEELRRRDEKEIEDDYREADGDEQGREIEHLLLVTHGIGQRLGLRLESVNFVHDVNTFRKCLKSVYTESPDLRALNAELDTAAKTNSRIQVLPICWRHLLDFPKQSLKHNRREHDLADSDFGDEEDYPSLDDISVDGVPAVRNLITDLALDILLYQSPAYKDHISRIVLRECNRIYHLFCERNPNFSGKVSLVGHSLGSAIMFDILCRQDGRTNAIHSSRHGKKDTTMKFDFDVHEFYALGSPIGLFQMLKGRTITGRETVESRSRALSKAIDDPFLDAAAASAMGGRTSNTGIPASEIPSSSPNCSQLYNIFHPTDPIAYRIEPLISPSMSTLKPQPLPYTKRGIFGAPVGQGFSGISARVGQSVSSLWSSMSSGIASSLLTRGLGYAGDEGVKLPNGQGVNKTNARLSMSAGPNAPSAGTAPPTAPLPAEGTKIEKIDEERLATSAQAASQVGHHPPTLIDQEIETLYGGYERRRKSVQPDDNSARLGEDDGDEALAEAEERGRRLRREEEKVRKLNSNGRVDYAIQEGAFDINLLAAIASHLSYWADEDVGHFMISQLLSRGRVVRERAGSGGKIPMR